MLVCFLFPFYNVCAQGEVPVDMYTGSPHVYVPLWTITDHDLSDAVGVSYSPSGLRLIESKGVCGTGWQLQAGGSIVREVRGLPDDYLGAGSDTRKGWFYNTIASDIANFSTTADLATSTCTDETTANNALSTYNYLTDTEPDIFYYNAGGVSGSFVFDNNLNIRLIPYRDVKIAYTQPVSGDKKLLSFTITTNNGVVYTFGGSSVNTVSVTRSSFKLPGITTVEFLRREFSQYDNALSGSGVTYNEEWKLTKAESPTGANLTYSYISKSYSSNDTVSVGIRKYKNSELVNKQIYYTKIDGGQLIARTITSSTGESVQFNSTNGTMNGIVISDSRRSTPYVKEFVFVYSTVGLIKDYEPRQFLSSIKEKSGTCEELRPYTFKYYAIDVANQKGNLPTIYSTVYSKDFWGYYNGRTNTSPFPKIYVYPAEPLSERFRLHPIPNYIGQQYTLNGADRSPNPGNVVMGTLKTVTYPSGGSTTFNYEPNDYYDSRTGQTLTGPGVRVKSIVYFDGVDAASNVVKDFEYLEDNHSSGRLISKPVFAIPTQEYRPADTTASLIKTYATLSGGVAQDMWEFLIVRSDRDIGKSLDGSVLGYKHVKVSRPGSGSAEFDYAMPAVYGENTSTDVTSDTWSATENKFTRPNTCQDMGIAPAGGTWGYAFSPNPNFSYERGFLLKKTDKDEFGNKVTETTYTSQHLYKSGTAPVKVWGVSYDLYPNSNSNIYFFGKYYWLTDVEKTVSTETTVMFEAADQNKTMTATAQYFYESTSHKLLSRTKFTAVDGTILTTKIKYPLDYGTIPVNSDVHLKTIGNLQATRNGTPVEQVSFMQKPSQNEKIMSASLIKFSDFGIAGKVFPYQQLSLKTTQGLTDFVESGKELEGATYVLKSDERYDIDNTFLAFDQYDVPLSSVGKSRIPVSTHWGFKKTLPVVQAVNAKHNEFAFSNFETDLPSNKTGSEFALSDLVFGTGRTGRNALYAGVVLSKGIQKANVNNYKLTFWYKRKTATAVNFTIKLKDVSTSTVFYTTTLTVNPSVADFEFVERIIPVTDAPANFTIELQAPELTFADSSPGLTPVIDDVAFYPENADLISYTYTIPFGANSVTDAKAKTAYTVYDNLGRKKYVLDQDGNIRQKTTYQFTQFQPPAPSIAAVIIMPTTVYDNIPVSFTTNDDDCIDGVVYEWDFGNGYAEGSKSMSYTFTTTGTKTIYLRKTHPLYGSDVASKTFTVTLAPIIPTICGKGASNYGAGTEFECSGVLSSFPACSQILGTPAATEVIFGVASTGTSETITNWQWRKRAVGTSTWTNKSSDANHQFKQTNLSNEPSSFEVQCVLTTSAGRIGYSNILVVTITNCQEQQ